MYWTKDELCVILCAGQISLAGGWLAGWWLALSKNSVRQRPDRQTDSPLGRRRRRDQYCLSQTQVPQLEQPAV